MRPLVAVLEFKYLGRDMMELDGDWLTVVGNFSKARKQWAWMSWILVRKGADPRTLGNFHKAVVQATILFRTEYWVMPPWIGKTLVGFHPRVALWMKKNAAEEDWGK